MRTKDAILEQVRGRGRVVEVPEWDARYRVRGLTAQHRLWLSQQDEGVDDGLAMAHALSRSVRDADTGARAFTAEEWLELIELDDQGVVVRLAVAMTRRSGADEDGVARAERDFVGAPSPEPSSSSPESSAEPPPSS